MSHKIGAIATLAILTVCGEVAYEPAVTSDASLPDAADAADAAFRDAGYDASDAGFRADADASLPVDADVDADAALPPEKVIDVSVGVEYVCALFESHRIKCWGNGFGGELGTGVATWRGAHPGELTPQTPFVDVGPARTITSVHAGSGSTFVLLDNHQVGAWGLNRFGSLGAGIAEESGSFQMGSGLLHVLLGSNRTVTELSADNGVGCALLDDGSVKCWG